MQWQVRVAIVTDSASQPRLDSDLVQLDHPKRVMTLLLLLEETGACAKPRMEWESDYYRADRKPGWN
jgi:hypothetical protein